MRFVERARRRCAPCVLVHFTKNDYGPATKLARGPASRTARRGSDRAGQRSRGAAIAIAGRRPPKTSADRSQVGTAEALRADAAVADAVGAEDPDRVVVVAADDDHEWEPFALARARVRDVVRAIDGAPAPGDAPVRGLRAGRGDAQGRGLRRGRGRLDLLQLRVPAVRARRPGAAPAAGSRGLRADARSRGGLRWKHAGSAARSRRPAEAGAGPPLAPGSERTRTRAQVEPRREPAGEPDLRRPGRRLCGNQPPVWDVPTKL